MKIDLAKAMRAATRLTRGRKLTEATRLILDTLLGGAAKENPRKNSGRIGRPLGEVIDTLSKVKRRGVTSRGRKAGKLPVIPAGATFLERSFSCSSGTRTYRLYVPRRLAAPAPLVVMLHGCTQDAGDFAIGTGMNALAEEMGFLVAYPNQTRSHNPSSCWNWFNPRDQRRDQGEPGILAGLTRAIMADYEVDPRLVFVAGLSAGGAMAAVMGATYPDLFTAIGVHSGLAHGSASDVVSAFAAMRGDANSRRPDVPPQIRTIVIHGAADTTVHPSNAMEIVAGLTADRSTDVPASGRSATRTVLRDAGGNAVAEHWLIHGAGHAWAGGHPDGSYTDPEGPDASREMLRFFLDGENRPRAD